MVDFEFLAFIILVGFYSVFVAEIVKSGKGADRHRSEAGAG